MSSLYHILISGGTGYIGGHIVRAAYKAGVAVTLLPRDRFAWRRVLPESNAGIWFVNAAGFTGRNVDDCAKNKAECIEANLMHAVFCAEFARDTGLRLLHVSTGCVFHSCDPGHSFNEDSVPNFTFDDKQHSFYSGIKAEAEKRVVKIRPNTIIARLRMPFDFERGHKNMLHRIISHKEVWELGPNTMTFMPDAAQQMVLGMVSGCDGFRHYMSNDALRNDEIVFLAKECGLIPKCVRLVPEAGIPPTCEPRSVAFVGSKYTDHGVYLRDTVKAVFTSWATKAQM